nr:hypothetical protein [Tanacetum cinerariifolium]
MDDVSKQWRIITDMDADKDVTLKDVANVAKDVQDAEIKENSDVQGRQAESQVQIYQIDLEHADKVLSMQDVDIEPAKLQEVVEVITTAKFITEVVIVASATITVAAPQLTTTTAPTLTTAPSAARRRKGVVIRDPKETATPSTIIHTEAKSKDKGKGILAELNNNIDWDEVIDHVQRKEKEDNVVKIYQALKRKPQTKAQDRKNMMIYLRNKIKEQMEEEDSRALKRLSKSQEDKAPKKHKLDEEVEELRKHLMIVPNEDDDVYTEATPLALKMHNNVRLEVEEESKVSLELLRHEALAIPGQTTTGKENSNMFMADSLPKTILLTFIHGICINMSPFEFSLIYLVVTSVQIFNAVSSKLMLFGLTNAAIHLMLLCHNPLKFLMYPRFLQLMINAQVADLSSYNTKYTSPALTQKVFANMRRVGKGFSGVDTPLFDDKIDQAIKITKLKQRVKRLEKKRQFKSLGLKRLKKVRTAQWVESSANTVMDNQEDASKQGGKIAKLVADEDVTLEDVDAKVAMDANIQGRLAESQAKVYHLDLQHAEKVLYMQDTSEAEPAKVEEVIEVVTIAKLITEVVTTAATTITAAQVPKASAPRRRNGVVIQDHEEIATTSVIMHSKVKSKDKGKRILIKEPKPLKRQTQIEQDKAFARQLEAELNANINWNDVVDQEVKKEKESIVFKIEKFENASKDLDRLLRNQKLDKDMKCVGFNKYCAIQPPPAQVYSSPKKDLYWIGLPKFVDDTVTDYTRLTPSIDVSKSVTHSNVKRPFKRRSTAKNKVWSLTVRPKILTVGSKVPTAKPTVAADKGYKGKVIKTSARWIWKPKQTTYGQESIDFKIENFENALKDLDRLLGSQKLDKDMKGVGFNEYCVVPPPPAQVFSPPKKDLSCMGLHEFVDDTVTDYTRPTPSIDLSKSISHFAREFRSPRSQDRQKRESYKKDPKVEKPAPKEMIAIDGIRWDWSYMAEEDETSKNHALVADEEELPIEYALMAKSSSSSNNELSSYEGTNSIIAKTGSSYISANSGDLSTSSGRRTNNKVVLVLISFFLFCMSSAVIATVLPFFFVEEETSPAGPLSLAVSYGGALLESPNSMTYHKA